MTTYTTIANSAIDQDSPVTQTLMQALRDNPIAITEGATGAPKNKPESLDIYIADGSVLRTSSGTSTILTVTDLDGMDYILVLASVSGSTDATISSSVEYALSSDNGSTFGGNTTIVSISSSGSQFRTIAINLGANNAIRFQIVLTESGTSASTGSVQAIGLGV